MGCYFLHPNLMCRQGNFFPWSIQIWWCQQGDVQQCQTGFWLFPSKIPAPFPNVCSTFVLLFMLTPFCKSSCYGLIQLMAAILFGVLSLNHRILRVGRDLWRPSSPTVLQWTGTPQLHQLAQGLIQPRLESLQGLSYISFLIYISKKQHYNINYYIDCIDN